MNYNKNPAPCLNCQDRYVGLDENGKMTRCHATCEKFQEYQLAMNKHKKKMVSENEYAIYCMDVKYNNTKHKLVKNKKHYKG